jgi:hypothetical protein
LVGIIDQSPLDGSLAVKSMTAEVSPCVPPYRPFGNHFKNQFITCFIQLIRKIKPSELY